MKKSKSLNPPSIGKTISRFLYRFHFVLFIVIVLGGLAVVIFLLSQTLVRASDTSHADPIMLQPFDRQTIEKLDQLNSTPATSSELQFPDGRINPFSE